MKLAMLRPRLQAVGNRLATLAPARPNVVERKRGWAGVQDRNRIRARDKGQCQQCIRERRSHINNGFQVDHVVPLWDGGTDDDSNKETICDEHHKIKTAREAKERAARGF
jgi:5-methylcytosine-specific restriction endonuclease McrA